MTTMTTYADKGYDAVEVSEAVTNMNNRIINAPTYTYSGEKSTGEIIGDKANILYKFTSAYDIKYAVTFGC